MVAMLQPKVCVVIPAHNEARTIGGVVAGVVALSPRAVADVVVVDDGSTDATARAAADAGARVIDANARGLGRGKGQAMWIGVTETTAEIVVFCDGDLEDFDGAYVTELVAALVASPTAVLAKARYRRHGTGGRVNELLARPALALLHPHLAHLAQPLGGEYAGWRHALESVPFVHGYGVDLGLVLDLAEAFGPDAIVEADLGARTHRNRPLAELRPQAEEVLAVALDRAGVALDPARIAAELPPVASLTRGRLKGA